VARARRRRPWPGGSGQALALADLVAVVATGLAVGAGTASLGAAAVALLVAWAADLYRPRLVLSIGEALPGLLVAAGAATAVLVGASDAPARTGVPVLAGLVLAHTVVYASTHLLRRTGRHVRRVLVLGTGTAARRLVVALLGRPELGLRPVGFVATGDRAVGDQARGLPLALLGPVTSLPRVMSDARVDAVVVALSGPAGDAETAAVEGLLAAPADVLAVPTWFPPVSAHARHPAERIGDVPLVGVHPRGTPPPLRVLHKGVDVLVALASVAVLLPVVGLLALPVLIETGGVLVRRTRVDDDGRPVWVPRFRTRRARAVGRAGTTFSVAISGRTGPVGLLLRRSGLDALPEVLTTQVRRLRHPGGGPATLGPGSAAPARADQPQVDAGQLTR